MNKWQVLSAVAVLGLGAILSSAASAAEAAVPAEEITAALEAEGGTVFPIGQPNDANAKYFTGESYVASLASSNVRVANVTFAPGCINHWHVHHGSCQILVGVSGRGWYQILGEAPKEIHPGETVTIPAETKHWHGAAKDAWFQHLAIMQNGATTTWMEPVDTEAYNHLEK